MTIIIAAFLPIFLFAARGFSTEGLGYALGALFSALLDRFFELASLEDFSSEILIYPSTNERRAGSVSSSEIPQNGMGQDKGDIRIHLDGRTTLWKKKPAYSDVIDFSDPCARKRSSLYTFVSSGRRCYSRHPNEGVSIGEFFQQHPIPPPS